MNGEFVTVMDVFFSRLAGLVAALPVLLPIGALGWIVLHWITHRVDEPYEPPRATWDVVADPCSGGTCERRDYDIGSDEDQAQAGSECGSSQQGYEGWAYRQAGQWHAPGDGQPHKYGGWREDRPEWQPETTEAERLQPFEAFLSRERSNK